MSRWSFLQTTIPKNAELLTSREEKFPQMNNPYFARVNATFNLWRSDKNPTPLVLTQEKIIISFSWPWYESMVLISTKSDNFWGSLEKEGMRADKIKLVGLQNTESRHNYTSWHDEQVGFTYFSWHYIDFDKE